MIFSGHSWNAASNPLANTHKLCDKVAMARRKADPGEEFSQTDLAIAAGCQKRIAQLLVDAGAFDGLAPVGKMNMAGAIGGIMSANVPPLLAMKLAKTLTIETKSGEFETGFKYMANGLDASAQAKITEVNDFWLHRELMLRRDLYKPGLARQGDFVAEIVDGALVFTRSFGWQTTLNSNTKMNLAAHFSGWINDWKRAAEPSFKHLAEHFDFSRLGEDEFQQEIEKHEKEMQNIYTNSVSKLSVNLSLAIRNSFDRLHQHRFRIDE